METATPHVLLCARDQVVIEAVEVSAAALEVPLRVVSDAQEARSAWPAAAARLLGAEVAARWESVPAGEAHLVGRVPADLARCSAELGLPVLPLPDETGRLADLLARVVRARGAAGQVVALTGASGGLGVSTLAVGLALAAARAGQPSAAVEVVGSGGGIDLLVGAEGLEGLRWDGLANARGEVGEVWARLPRVGGAGFLAQSRESPGGPSPAALEAVLSALGRDAALVLVDAGREPPPGCDRHLLVVGADVRSVAAAQMAWGAAERRPSGVVVRRGPGRRIPAAVVARALGVAWWAQIDHDAAVPRLAEAGLPPTGARARRFGRQASALLKRLTDA